MGRRQAVITGRDQNKLKLLITGQTGAGKTLSALLIASGMLAHIEDPKERGKKIYHFDLEKGRAKNKYGAPELPPGFKAAVDMYDWSDRTPNGFDYVDVIQSAIEDGYELVILDGISPEWDTVKSEADIIISNGGSKAFGNNWSRAKEKTGHNRFIQVLRDSDIHIIATARSKTNKGQNNEGKTTKESGDAMVQSDTPFEFDFIFDIMNRDHIVEVDKTEGGLFTGQSFKITERTGKIISNWLNSADADAVVERRKAEVERQESFVHNPENKGRLLDVLKVTKQDKGLVPRFIQEVVGEKKKAEEITLDQCSDVILLLVKDYLSSNSKNDLYDAFEVTVGTSEELKELKNIASMISEQSVEEDLAGAIG